MSTACECVCVCTALISRLRAGARGDGSGGVAMKTKQHLKVKANGKRLAKKGGSKGVWLIVFQHLGSHID